MTPQNTPKHLRNLLDSAFGLRFWSGAKQTHRLLSIFAAFFLAASFAQASKPNFIIILTNDAEMKQQ